MSNPVSTVTEAPAQVVGFAKRKPVTFALMLLAAALLILRFRSQIVSLLGKVPLLGKFFSKFVGAAVVLFGLLFVAPEAFAATGAVCCGEPTTFDWSNLWQLLAGSGVALGASLAGFPVPFSQDLRSDGKTSQTLTVGTAAQSVDFKIESTKAEAGGAYKRVTAICGRLLTQIDQPSTDGTAINWDDLPRIIDGLVIDSPVFGELLSKNVSDGPILKHVIEFVGNGYHYAEGATAQIAAADGDTAVALYFCYPVAPNVFVRPADFALWIGWLEKTICRFWLGGSADIAAVSTGAAIEATTSVQMWADYIVDNDVEVGPIARWDLHQQSAGGGTAVVLQNIGANSGLRRVEEYSRLAGLYMLTDQKGMGGPDGVDNVTGLEIPKLDFANLVNVDAIILAYKRAMGGRRGPFAGTSTTIMNDGSGNPEGMAATPITTLKTSSLMYLPIMSPGLGQEISKLKKFKGDLSLNYSFTTAPSSGNHKHVLFEVRDLTLSDRKQLLQMAGCRGMKLATADGNTGADAARESGAKTLLGLPSKGIR